VILAGGSGLLGRSLSRLLAAKGSEVIVLSRSHRQTENGVRFAQWDGRTVGEWASLLDGADAVVNLTGKSVNCRYTPENRREIVRSRVESVAALGAAIARCGRPPRVLVQAGSLAFYGTATSDVHTEDSPPGRGFSPDVCRQWEAAFDDLALPGTRKVLLRIGFALAGDGGALKTLGALTKCFLGGTVGSGGQYISWIHIADLNRMFEWAIEREEITGTFNATGPAPVTNAEFMRELRAALHRPWSPPVPEWLARLGAWAMRTEADLALTGLRCLPERFVDHGFAFEYPELGGALRAIYENA
jgi:uncharacterized protein (TIGR01777 family)